MWELRQSEYWSFWQDNASKAATQLQHFLQIDNMILLTWVMRGRLTATHGPAGTPRTKAPWQNTEPASLARGSSGF